MAMPLGGAKSNKVTGKSFQRYVLQKLLPPRNLNLQKGWGSYDNLMTDLWTQTPGIGLEVLTQSYFCMYTVLDHNNMRYN